MKVRTLSAGVVVVRREAEAWRCLLLRAYQYWDAPKGRVEAGETPLEAAQREVREETGIDDLDFSLGFDFIETGPYSRGKMARYYLAMTTTRQVVLGVSPELGRPEHQEYRWVSFRRGRQIASPRVRRVLTWAEHRLQDTEAHQGDPGAERSACGDNG